ncbi:MAG TPA: hypothetical protein VIL07_05860 [Symbiobacteriaceae bacterium]
MPMLEVIRSGPEALTLKQKQAFVREAEQIFREVLGTPPGRLRLLFQEIAPTDTLEGLKEAQD